MTGAAPAGTGSRADVWAGLAAAAVVLPQAMAFGVALFQGMGIDAATGAVAGLIGAIALCAASGVAGATGGLISSPTGPSLALLSGAIVAIAAAGVEAPMLLPALIAVTVFAGLSQVALGALGGARLVRYIPHSVVSGFMIGSAVLMLRSQLGPLSGPGADPHWTVWRWLPAATAAATLLAQFAAPRWLPRLPGAIAGLAVGTVVFSAVGAFAPGPLPPGWLIGQLPPPALPDVAVAPSALLALPWPGIVASGLALGLMASLNILLTATIADGHSGLRHDARRELVAQGIGQTLAGLLGGMGGSATTGATMLAVRTGGRRWAALVAAAVLAATVLFLGPAAAAIPVSALAGIIIAVALRLVDLDVIAWARRRRTRQDAGIALVVAVATVQFGLITAIGIGVVIAIVLFVNSQLREPVVHRRTDGRQRHSLRQRTGAQRAQLEAHGDRIVLYELRGNLFFARADELFDELMPDLDRPAWVILDLYRVAQVDLTGIKILEQAARRIARAGGELIFCEVYRSQGLGRQVAETLRRLSPRQADLPRVRTFVSDDEALDHAETALLAELGMPPASPAERVAVGETELCRALTPEQLAAIEAVLRPRACAAGTVLFGDGEAGHELYVVLRGEVEIRLRLSEHHYKRLAIYGPGTHFGDVAFLDPGPRTSGARAVLDSELCVLDRADFDRMRQRHPDAAIAFLLALGRTQSHTMRWNVAEIHSLSQH